MDFDICGEKDGDSRLWKEKKRTFDAIDKYHVIVGRSADRWPTPILSFFFFIVFIVAHVRLCSN